MPYTLGEYHLLLILSPTCNLPADSPDQVAVIDQYAIFDFIAGIVNQACGAYQSELFRGGVFVIIEIHHVAMQISGFHDTQIDRRCIHTGGNQRGGSVALNLIIRDILLLSGIRKKRENKRLTYRTVKNATILRFENDDTITVGAFINDRV